MELIRNNGDQFSKKTFLETTYSFLPVCPQPEDFSHQYHIIRNILGKIKINFFLYPRACPHIWSRVSRFSKENFQSQTGSVWKLVIHKKAQHPMFVSVTIVYCDRLDPFSKEYYLQCIIWSKMWCKSSQKKSEISFVVSHWSTDKSLIKVHSGFISSPALSLWKPFPEIQFSQTCFSHHATFSSATQENTAQRFSLPTAFLCYLCNVRALAVPIPCCSSFPYTWKHLAHWFQHMDRAGKQAIMGALMPTNSSAAAAGGALLDSKP